VTVPADPAHWFLAASERDNAATQLDRRHRDGVAWTEGNHVEVLVDGTAYFPRVLDAVAKAHAGDWILVADLQSDGDERLDGDGSEIATVLADAAERGVAVRGLLWRSHPAGHGAAEIANTGAARRVNDAGGELLLDHRVRRGGSHHQKIVVVRHGDEHHEDDVAFVGGIDLAHGRNDSPAHLGDEQAVAMGDARYGERPPWHDVQVRIAGPAVDDVIETFRERWLDPLPLEGPSPLRPLRGIVARNPPTPGALPPTRPQVRGAATAPGPHAVQILRTYPARRHGYPFAPHGERSIARAYLKALARARRFVYIEDQYLWSLDATRALCDALRAQRELHCVVILPRHPDLGGVLGRASRFGRSRVERALAAAGGDRVHVFDLENTQGTPIYVHAKVCIVDDIWMTIGSDNLNRRSWTHDSEICCAVVDRAGELPRATRLRLAREHLADTDGSLALDEPELWIDALTSGAHQLDTWHARSARGARPLGHLRVHPSDRVARRAQPALHLLHAWLLDPDGRPRELRRAGRY